jgi:hypothetical protein
MTEYRNCYIWSDSRNSESEQRATIAATGPMAGRHAKTVVEDGKKGTQPRLAALWKTTRRGELLVVSEPHRLGENMAAVTAAIEKATAKGVIIYIAAWNWRSDNGAQWWKSALATDQYFKHRLGTVKARAAGLEGARSRWEGRGERVPLDVAVTRWNRAVRRGATATEAIAAVNDGYAVQLTYRTLRRLAVDGKLPGELVPLPAGRRPAK